ncbi:MAG TPA: YggT family protein [Anaerolineales bacterium]|nr:YggT family protein [Anaerolineales bacterium]HLO29216.1 YggT family protein [Anaerolineales bacterium]
MTVDRDQIARRKRVIVHQDGDHVHEERVVENVNLEYRETIYKVVQFVWLLFGGLEALIGIRIILLLIGANPANWFTAFVYQLSDVFLWPFRNIVGNPAFQKHVLEITSLIAMLVYSLIGWAIARLIWVLFYRAPTSQVTTYDRERHV